LTDYRAGRKTVQHKDRIRRLRRDQTDAERILWQRLRASQLAGFKFRRQHEFGGFILDFYCPTAKLAVELDGGQHLSASGLAYDTERSRILQSSGIRIVRFTNTAVLAEIDAVLEAIAVELRRSDT
jgi:very-short-patch-repair endonuclease